MSLFSTKARTLAPLVVLVGIFAASLPIRAQNWAEQRREMVARQLEARDITDPQVLRAMRTVPRHLFVPEGYQEYAYEDRPLAIGEGQTISQPYIVALMTQLVRPDSTDHVLEVGTGSGYQAAVLAEIVQSVKTIEIVGVLAAAARARLDSLGYRNVEVRHGDGYNGWMEHAPYDAIIVTAAPEEIPPPLIEQLKDGGRMVIPVGAVHGRQRLQVVMKENGKIDRQTIIPVRFVPFTRDN